MTKKMLRRAISIMFLLLVLGMLFVGVIAGNSLLEGRYCVDTAGNSQTRTCQPIPLVIFLLGLLGIACLIRKPMNVLFWRLWGERPTNGRRSQNEQ
jgi:hypothetical protein